MSFRPATYDDAPLLLGWRHADEHANWYEGHNTDVAAHVHWLTLRLQSPLVKLLIWAENGCDIGMVRIDSNGELAFHCDNDDACVRMIQATHAYAGDYGGRLKASVDTGNERAWQMLAQAGYSEHPTRFLCFKP